MFGYQLREEKSCRRDRVVRVIFCFPTQAPALLTFSPTLFNYPKWGSSTQSELLDLRTTLEDNVEILIASNY